MLTSKLDNKPIADGHGWAVYRPESFIQRTGKTTDGKNIVGFVDSNNWFTTDPLTCIEIFKSNYLVHSIVSRHAQIISSLQFKVVTSESIEDEIAYKLKRCKNMIELIGNVEIEPDDFKHNLKNKIHLIKERNKHFSEIKRYLGQYYLRNDLSNFDACLRQYSKDIKHIVNQSASEIEDWIYKPSDRIQIQDFLIQYVIDLLIHGKAAIQLPTLQFDEKNRFDLIKNDLEAYDGFQLLPGGSVFTLARKYIGEDVMLGLDSPAYIQLLYNAYGYGTLEPKIFSAKEISTAQYLPSSSLLDGFKPIDCIIQAITEVNNFSNMMVNYANEDKPPEYLIFVVDDSSMFGQGTSISDMDKVSLDEVDRIEQSVNTKRKDETVRVMKQLGKDVKLLNISKENILGVLSQREERIERIINRAFNGTSNELSENETGSIINNSTGEMQNTIYYNSVVKPIIKTIENQFTYEILRQRFGVASNFNNKVINWHLKFQDSESDIVKYNKAILAKNTGLISNNEIRTSILGLDPTGEPDDDKLPNKNMMVLPDEI